jgi:WD40 repeat protein
VISKVLDAPDVLDEFPSQLIDFSRRNQLAVALGTTIYLWDDDNVNQLMEADAPITALCWVDDHLAISARGEVELWDVSSAAIVRAMVPHTERCAAMAFRSHRLATGGADCLIHVSDHRAPAGSAFTGHRGEVARLAWSPDSSRLASGGCDARVIVWGDQKKKGYEFRAPIHGLNWVAQGVIAVAEDDSDGIVRCRSVRQGDLPVKVATGAPVCSIGWSEPWGLLVAHHRTRFDWEIWSHDFRKLGQYTGHSADIVQLAVSGDGSLAATIGTDETLQIWQLRDGKARTPLVSRKGCVSLPDSLMLR